MAETKTTTSTRGRKPKTETVDIDKKLEIKEEVKVENTSVISQDEFNKVQKEKDDLATMLAQLQAQMIQLQSQVSGTQKKVNDNRPNKVKVVNLLSQTLNLSTEPMGGGKVFTFEGFGDMVTMKTSYLEDILSIPIYRKEAEQMFFYICSPEIVEDQDLTDSYENGITEETVRFITSLQDDKCVDMFVGLSKGLQDSISTKIAEDMAKGIDYDRNRLADIQMRTEIDIQDMAKTFKEINERISR
jgi:hypothetical protein